MIKIAYICHFSNQRIRKYLHLKSFWLGNLLRKVARIQQVTYVDFASWNNNFINILSNNKDYECNVVSYHLGMKREEQQFTINNTHYFFIREKEYLLKKIWNTIIHSGEDNTYPNAASNIKKVVDKIDPDIIVVCGAENPIYSSSALCFKDKPVFVILQTLLNSPKRIELGIGTPYRRQLENDIFRQINYFGSFNIFEAHYIKGVNPNAFCFKIMFPSSAPQCDSIQDKNYDFVFFANGLSKYKGTEDVLKGFSIVQKKYPNSKLNVIGSCDASYKVQLESIMEECGIRGNVFFNERYPRQVDMLNQVMRSKIAVLPGITASLNSTVRESMYMGIPVITYENDVTGIINREKKCVLTAKMEDIFDLGMKMLFAYENPSEMVKMAFNARDYAENTFSKEAVGKQLYSILEAVMENFYKKLPVMNSILL